MLDGFAVRSKNVQARPRTPDRVNLEAQRALDSSSRQKAFMPDELREVDVDSDALRFCCL